MKAGTSPLHERAVAYSITILTVYGVTACIDAGTNGTVRINIHGRHSTNKDFLVSRNKEDRTLFDPNLFCRGAWNSFLITTDGRL